jgi:hypothetical protein
MNMKNETKAEALALAALNWTLSDHVRAERFLGLTGMMPDDIRARIGEPEFLAASLRFLESYEPDLISCAEALTLSPKLLVEARRELER